MVIGRPSDLLNAVSTELGCIEYTAVVDHEGTPAPYGTDSFVSV